jgi:signal transduction histidine kinase
MRVRALDLRQVVAAAVERARPAALLAGGSVECDLPPAPVVVEADEQHLGRILDNRLGNATTHGGARAEVCARVAGGAAPVVLVEDHGRGIVAEARDHIFERFFRSRDSAARPGSGLGLYISRQLARQLGGDVTLEASEPDVRTVFALRLPASRRVDARRS